MPWLSKSRSPLEHQAVTTRRVYAFIVAYMGENCYAPTIREIVRGSFLSVGSVIRHLNRLETIGRIEREPGRHRGIRLVADGTD